jgi:3-hydroxyacyl-[acyl-carrier-protein] dehydratase
MSVLTQTQPIKAIEELLPHRAPFLFVDEILSATLEEVTGTNVFDHSEFICKNSIAPIEFVPGVILIESMAQCGGAGARMLAISDGLFGLANIEVARFHKPVPFGVKVHYVVKNIRVSAKLVKQSGVAYVNNEPVAEATWMCIKIG